MSQFINVIPTSITWRFSAGFWLLLAATVAPLWFTGYIFFQDYPDWIIQGALVKDMLLGNHTANIYEWAVMPLPPNVLTTLSLALLQTVFSPDISGRLLIILLVVIVAGRIYTVCGSAHPLRYWGFFLVLNFYCYAGFLPFIAGLAVTVFVVPQILTGTGDHPRSLRLLIGSLLTYLVHGFAFGLFLLAVFWRLLAALQKEKNSLRHLTGYLALLPVLIVCGHYIWTKPVHDNQAMMLYYDSFLHWAQTLRYGLMPLPRVAGVVSDFPLSLINGIFWLLIATSLPLLKEMLPRRLATNGFLLTCFVLVVFNPFFRIANFMNISPRMFPALLLLLPMLLNQPQMQSKRHRWLPTAAILFLIITNGFYLYANGGTIDRVRQQISEHDGLKTRLVIGKLPVEDFDKRILQVMSGVIQPFIRINFVDRLQAGDYDFNIQETAILKQNQRKHQVALRRTDRLFDHARTHEQMALVADREKAWLGKHFQQVLLFGTKATRQAVVTALAENYDCRSSGDQWQLLERINEE